MAALACPPEGAAVACPREAKRGLLRETGPAGSKPPGVGAEVCNAWWREGWRRREVEEEADVWASHVSGSKGEKQKVYFELYENMWVCEWLQEHRRRKK